MSRKARIWLFILLTMLELTGRAQSSDSLQFLIESNSITQENLPEITQQIKNYAERNPDSALFFSQQVLKIVTQNQWEAMKGQVLISLSTSYSYMAQYDSSTRYALLAVQVAEELHDTVTLIDGFNNIGIDFMFQEEDAKAIEYFEKVEQLSRISQDSLRWGHALNNLGMMAGFAEESLKELEKYSQAAAIFQSIGEKEGFANTLLNTGTTYTVLKEYRKAEEFYAQALSEFKSIDVTSGIQNTIQSSAENLMLMGNLPAAQQKAETALELAINYNFGQDIIYTYDLLSQIAEKKGNYREAFKFEKKRNTKKEEVFNLEKSQQIAEIEAKYETAKKEAEIERLSYETDLKSAQLKNSHILMVTGGISTILIFTLLVLIYRQRLKKHKAEAEIHELRIEAFQKRLMELNATPPDLVLDFEELNQKLNTTLSKREFEALQLSLDGKTNTEIADVLFIAMSTVKFHLRNAYSKLGVQNRKEALRYISKSSQ